MKAILLLIISIVATIAVSGTTRDELNSRIDNANELRRTNSRGAITPLREIFLEASQEGYDDESARALTYLGWALYNCNYPDLAIQVLSFAETYCRDSCSETASLIRLSLGASYSANVDFAKGERLLRQSLNQSIKSGNAREQMMIYTYLGDLYSNQAKDAKAKECFEKGRDLAHQVGDTVFESALYCNVGILSPDLAEAEAQLFRSIELSQQSDNTTTECYAYINLAEVYFNNHLNAKALRTAEQITRFLPYIDSNDKIRAYYHNLMANIYADNGDFASAYNSKLLSTKQRDTDEAQISKERAEYYAMVIDMMRQSQTHRLNRQEQAQQSRIAIMVIAIVAILIILAVVIFMYRKSRRQRRQLSRQLSEINKLEQREELHTTQISDANHTMGYLYGFYRGRNDLLEKLSQMIKEGYKMSSPQLQSHLRIINHTIQQSLTTDKEPEWIKRLQADNEAFVKRLKERYPNISKTDILLASSYRLGLTTRDISRLSGKIPTTITTARYRLRTSLNIAEDADLYEFFNAI